MADLDVTIGTHDGTFHADELVACALLKQLPEYTNAKIVRSRDPDVLAKCTIVVDVGSVYHHESNRYDHHQREFSYTFQKFCQESPWNIKLSSAGLIYVHYGKRILAQVTGLSEKDQSIDLIYKKIYSNFISEIDAIDNGVQMTSEPLRYSIHTDLSKRVSWMNPDWTSPDLDERECFDKALDMVKQEVLLTINYYAKKWYPARHLVQTALASRYQIDSSGAIFLLEQHCPWIGHFHDLENDELMAKGRSNIRIVPQDALTMVGRPLFCVYPRKDGHWAAQSIPVSSMDKFEQRLPFPKAWCGLRDDKLDQTVGYTDCIFVHSTGFMAVHQTKEGILHMVRKTLHKADLISSSE